MTTDDERTPQVIATTAPRSRAVPLVLGAVVLAVLALGGAMLARARGKTNDVALAASPKGVTVVEARQTTFRKTREYVGTIEPWLRAKVGPQLVSAYVDTVLFRPGGVVKRGDVMATLDCRNASAQSRAVAMQARALEAKQSAISHEAARIAGLLDGGFVSPNEAEQKKAESASQEAQLLAEKAKLLGTSLEVNDCVLRAPFDGEVAARTVDPGAFVRPGTPILTLVDRGTVRVSLEVPEVDFDVVAPKTPVKLHVVSTGDDVDAVVSRRAPAADPSTRTVHVEIDVPDPAHAFPVGTTAEATIEVGEPLPATEIPLSAASIRGAKAKLFVVEGAVATDRSVAVLGESGGSLFVATSLQPGTLVVTEGRALLAKGDHVTFKRESTVTTAAPTAPGAAAAQPANVHAAEPGSKKL